MHNRNFRLYRSQLAFMCYQEGLGESPLTYPQELQCYESGISLEAALDICLDVYFSLNFAQSFNLAKKGA